MQKTSQYVVVLKIDPRLRQLIETLTRQLAEAAETKQLLTEILPRSVKSV